MSLSRLIAAGLLLAGCQFQVAAVDVSPATSDLSGVDAAPPRDLAVPDLAGADLAGEDFAVADDLAGADLATVDLAMPDMAMVVCPAALFCSGSTLTHCDGGTIGCGQLGCEPSAGGGPHCKLFYPSGQVTRGDLTTAGVTARTIGFTTTLHTDSGAIDAVRAPNADPDVEQVLSGIAYRRRGGVGIFTFGDLTVSNNVTLRLVGTAPVALVSTGDMTIAGIVDARGYDAINLLCVGSVAGPGGGVGATSTTAAGGTGIGGNGAGTSSQDSAGGAGAGHGDVGGVGGYAGPNAAPTCGTVEFAGGTAGAIYGGTATLVGGSGGGRGGGSGAGNGGGGGGVVQLVANSTLTVGDSAGPRGGVNAGGCGGRASGNDWGGGGGGSGGAILLEAPTIHLTAFGGLAANGGGGSGGDSGSAGTPGLLDTVRAGGGSGAAAGGQGGASKNVAGAAGTCDDRGGGGGGGAVGHIRINTLSVTYDSGSLLSPALDDMNSIGAPLATQGTIDAH